MDVSIIIINFNTKKITSDCINSILDSKITYKYEIIIVDNASTDGSVQELKVLFSNKINLIESKSNLGFAKANNLAIKTSKGNNILLLNSDTLTFNKNSINNLIDEFIQNNYVILSPILLNFDNSIQKNWFYEPSIIKSFIRISGIYSLLNNFFNFRSSKINIPEKFDYLSFACILIRKTVFFNIGFLDKNIKFYHEDCEFGLRCKKNSIKLNISKAYKIIHLGGSSTKNFSEFSFENDIKSLLYIINKHYNFYYYQLYRLTLFLSILLRTFFSFFGFSVKNQMKIYNSPKNDNAKKNIKREEKKSFIKLYYKLLKYILSKSYNNSLFYPNQF